MIAIYKKIGSLTLVLCFYVLALHAQQNHFMYVQTENKQPFYIKHDKKLLSSSVTGYLIIPKLQEGNYNLTIGFPKNEWPEQNISCKINSNDAGYVLKNFGEKGWGLFNLQTFDIVMAAKKPEADIALTEEKKIILPEDKPVVTETITEKKTILPEEKTTIIKSVPGKNIETAPVEVKTIEEKNVVKEESKPVTEIIQKEEPTVTFVPEQIKKVFNTKNNEGRELIYINTVNGQPDTIRVFIPTEKKNEIIAVDNKMSDPEPAIKPSSKPSVKEGEPKFIDIEIQNPNLKSDSSSNKPLRDTAAIKFLDPVKVIAPSRPQLLNSDCKNFASEDDFLRLRKKMASEDNDAGMIDVAKKFFKSRCFTTDQVKNLSVLFLKNEGKYNFFDVAYPFVSDEYNFSTLETQLSEGYFINRFKAMLRH